MNPEKLAYLVDTKRGLIWVRAGEEDFSLDANVKVDPKHYFNTLKGVFYMREYPDSAIKLFNKYKENLDNNDNDIEDFSKN
jgi:hypothetical protein